MTDQNELRTAPAPDFSALLPDLSGSVSPLLGQMGALERIFASYGFPTPQDVVYAHTEEYSSRFPAAVPARPRTVSEEPRDAIATQGEQRMSLPAPTFHR